MNPNNPGKPSPDDLAGIPVTHEETPPLTRPRNGRTTRPRTQPAPIAGKTPTPEDLAGIPVCVVAKEDCTIRPRRQR